MEKLKTVDDLKNLRKLIEEETFVPDTPRVRLCSGTACTATGTPKVLGAIEEEAAKRGISVDIVKTGCQGLCQKGPVTDWHVGRILLRGVDRALLLPAIICRGTVTVPLRGYFRLRSRLVKRKPDPVPK